MRNLREVLDAPSTRPSRARPTRRQNTVVPSRRASPGGTRTPAFKVDPASPIGAKWQEAGGAAKVGEPTGDMRSALDSQVRYQTFEKGAIFLSEAFGATLIDAGLFTKWSQLGSRLQNDMGPPIADSKRVIFGRSGSVAVATFQKARSSPAAARRSRCTAGSTSAGAR